MVLPETSNFPDHPVDQAFLLVQVISKYGPLS
jgi:hypothetical protein